MHYCVLLITKKFPTERDIDDIMQPYCYNNIEYDEDDESYGDDEGYDDENPDEIYEADYYI